MRILGIGEEVGAGRVREEEHVYTPILEAKLDRFERICNKRCTWECLRQFLFSFFFSEIKICYPTFLILRVSKSRQTDYCIRPLWVTAYACSFDSSPESMAG